MKTAKMHLAGVAAVFLLATCAAAVPPGFNVQGRLTDSSGVNRDGVFSIRFDIYDQLTGGSPLWTKTLSGINVRNGNFQVIIADPPDAAGQAGLAAVFAGDARFLQMQVVSGPSITTPEVPLVPRQQLVSVPYSLVSASFGGGDLAVTSGIATFKVVSEIIAPSQSSSADPVIHFPLGNICKLTLDNSPALTFSGATAGQTLTLFLLQSGGNRTVTWPAGVKWPGGTAPKLTTTDGKTDIITVFYDGSSYWGFTSGLNY